MRYSPDGRLRVERVSVEDLCAEHGTPLYIYSAGAITSAYRALQSGLERAGLREAVICYAVKACPNIAIIERLVREGAGADIVSAGELARARRAGVPPGKIVFSGVGKTTEEMREAIRIGIHSFNVESVAEAETLSAVASGLRRATRMAMRFNPDVDARSHPYISTGLRRDKFGMERLEILEWARAAKRRGGLPLSGLSVHIGSQLLDLEPLEEAFARLAELSREVARVQGAPLEFLDVGGGVGVRYGSERPIPVDRYCRAIARRLGADRASFGGKIFLEPGRYLVGNAGLLATRVLYRKQRGSKHFVIVDAAMNDLIRPALYDGRHEILPARRTAPRPMGRIFADVVGPVCESSDFLGKARRLPADLAAGDLLAVLTAGAYGFSMASQYNSRPRPPEVLVDGRESTVIRRRETVADLLRGERLVGSSRGEGGSRKK